MADHSCRYCTKVPDDDYYVATQEELALTEIPIKSRYYAAKSPNRECKIISFKELYRLLSVTEQDVKNAPWPKIKKKVQQKKKEQLKKTTGNTIGDQLKAKGIDLTKLFK